MRPYLPTFWKNRFEKKHHLFCWEVFGLQQNENSVGRMIPDFSGASEIFVGTKKNGRAQLSGLFPTTCFFVCLLFFLIISTSPICKNFAPRVFRNKFYQSDDTSDITWPMIVIWHLPAKVQVVSGRLSYFINFKLRKEQFPVPPLDPLSLKLMILSLGKNFSAFWNVGKATLRLFMHNHPIILLVDEWNHQSSFIQKSLKKG